jgi:hypothetical protein
VRIDERGGGENADGDSAPDYDRRLLEPVDGEGRKESEDEDKEEVHLRRVSQQPVARHIVVEPQVQPHERWVKALGDDDCGQAYTGEDESHTALLPSCHH